MSIESDISILPKSDEKRMKFFKGLNEYIDLEYQIASAKAAQAAALETLYEDTREVEIKKADYKARAKLILEEFFNGKATTQRDIAESALDDYEIVQKHLKG